MKEVRGGTGRRNCGPDVIYERMNKQIDRQIVLIKSVVESWTRYYFWSVASYL